ncbi:hypothetical protein DU002_04530 [Corallincola holothuriorum]|uniref:RHS repeat-associated core domain-containing protein n=1 Tax=Corallincola holothuriorum TaxID=2282215 RepID=A0A368NR42_9GAMM|nr:hypothetical protein DU002_04530 [Corallincola holothuriorum]
MSADPHIQAANSGQNLNRYSYVMNNPLNATDPSGYIFQMLVVAAIQYFASNAAIASFFSAVSTVYSMFSLAQGIGQVAAGISQAYGAWTDGAGGRYWVKR